MVDLSLSKLLDNGTIKINSKKSSIKSPIAIKYKKKMKTLNKKSNKYKSPKIVKKKIKANKNKKDKDKR